MAPTGGFGNGGGGGSGRIDWQALRDRVLERVEIVEIARAVLGCEVKRKAGSREWVCLCPFHADGSPSLGLIPKKKMWYCHPCAIGGNAIDLVMRVRRVAFIDALKVVAELVGLGEEVYHAGSTPEQRAEAEARAKAWRAEAEAKRRVAEEITERERRAAIEAARFCWDQAGARGVGGEPGGGPDSMAWRYLEGRGVSRTWLALANGGELPACIRVNTKCKGEGESAPMGPALVAAFTRGGGLGSGELVGVQRIWLRHEGGRVMKIAGDGAKRERGSFSGGGAVRIVDLHGAEELYIGEGVETMAGVGAALGVMLGGKRGVRGVRVWSVLSTSGYQHVTGEVLACTVEAAGPLKRVIACVDNDKSRAGLKAARLGLAMIKDACPTLECVLAVPDHASAPELVGADGKFIGAAAGGKGVDWLDVVAMGVEGAAEALAGAVVRGERVTAEMAAAVLEERAGGGGKRAAKAGEAAGVQHGHAGGGDVSVPRYGAPTVRDAAAGLAAGSVAALALWRAVCGPEGSRSNRGVDDKRARAYFAGMGVRLEMLPEGRLPGCLRIGERCPRGWAVGPGGEPVREDGGLAVLAAAVDRSGKRPAFGGLVVLYVEGLSAGAGGAVAPRWKHGEARGFIELNQPRNGMLVVTANGRDGIEGGLALVAAGCACWVFVAGGGDVAPCAERGSWAGLAGAWPAYGAGSVGWNPGQANSVVLACDGSDEAVGRAEQAAAALRLRFKEEFGGHGLRVHVRAARMVGAMMDRMGVPA